MPDDKTPAAKKKGTRTAVIVGVIALAVGVGYFWIKNRQSGTSSGSGSTDSAGGAVTGVSGTDMADIIQVVQGPPGKTGPRGATGKTGASGDDDDGGGRKSKCPRGFHFMAMGPHLIPPEGSRKRPGGWCVPNGIRTPQPGG